MAFIQKLFTSYKARNDGDTRIGELNRIWYDSTTNSFRVQLDDTPGGTLISGGGGTGGDSNSFKTIRVSGFEDLVASTADTIEFVAGPGMTLITDPMGSPNKKLTFQASIQGSIIDSGGPYSTYGGVAPIDAGGIY